MLIDLRIIDTTPGAAGGLPFTPPGGFTGDAEAYRRLLRARWQHDRRAAQIILVAARQRHLIPMRIIGPYAAEASAVMVTVDGRAIPTHD